jgi:hypothetical protein
MAGRYEEFTQNRLSLNKEFICFMKNQNTSPYVTTSQASYDPPALTLKRWN